jgi:hypothetical protein
MPPDTAAYPPSLERLEVTFPEIHVDDFTRFRGIPPHLFRIELDAVDVFGILSPAVRIRVGQNEGVIHPLDNTLLVSYILGKARMPMRMHVPNPYSVSNRKLRLR